MQRKETMAMGSVWVTTCVAVVAFGLAGQARAQAECGGGACGTPYQSGGGGGGAVCNGGVCVTGSILIANTDMGDTYQYADDFDIDGWEDDFDNCPFAVNPGQMDSDGDGIGDPCDNCPSHSNPAQLDADGDWLGNLCDADADNDGVLNLEDNCMLHPNPLQTSTMDDTDGDGVGNICDLDDDNDGLPDVADPCPLLAGVTDPSDDRCDADSDDDGIPDSLDLCPDRGADDNADTDDDGLGDACDPDLDNDGVPNEVDNCRLTPNTSQLNGDRDAFGDACDTSFCFVVDLPDAARCLNPNGRYFGRPGPDATVSTGQRYRLRIFTNRPNAPTAYAWTVASGPKGGKADISFPSGTVNLSTPWEFHYPKERAAEFSADMPGVYQLELQSQLVFEDDLYPGLRTDVQTMTIVVEGEAVGCSAMRPRQGELGLGLLVLGLLTLGRRSRRLAR